MTLRVLGLSTLFPDESRPNFGIFVERQWSELASREGVDLTVLAPIGLPPFPLSRLSRYRPLSALPPQERWRGLDVHRPHFPILPAIGGRFNAALLARAVLPLVRRLHDEKPFDVIDASFFYPDGPAARRLSTALGIPYSVKARGFDIHHWGRAAGTRPQVLAAGRDAAGMLAVSEAMKRSMAQLGLSGDRIRVHYTGVDLDRFVPMDRAKAKAALGLTGPVLLSVGALIPRKSQDLVIRALTDIPDATLLLAGTGEMQRNYRALATELKLRPRVRFLGAVPHSDLPLHYAAADVTVLPSAAEGLANAWVESLACGTPLVLSDVGGAHELVRDDAAGHVVDRTPQAIAAAVNALLATPPDPAAVRRAAEPFTWAANGDALLAHLAGIAGKSGI